MGQPPTLTREVGVIDPVTGGKPRPRRDLAATRLASAEIGPDSRPRGGVLYPNSICTLLRGWRPGRHLLTPDPRFRALGGFSPDSEARKP